MHTDEMASGTPPRRAAGATSKARRFASRALVVVLAAAAFGAGALYGSLPSVTDAPARVAAITTGGRPVHIVPAARVARAVVAIEDERFFGHGAVDPVAVGRALVSTLSGGSVDPGGSTIAQQLAKVLYLDGRESPLNRLRAIGLAIKLERRFSKRRILEMYLNAVYFGHGFYGIAAASEGYFHRSPSALSWSQASLLAGLPQAPSLLDPLRYPRRAASRQRAVIDQLRATRVISTPTARRLRFPLLASRRIAAPEAP